jgi:hypothetical protein
MLACFGGKPRKIDSGQADFGRQATKILGKEARSESELCFVGAHFSTKSREKCKAIETTTTNSYQIVLKSHTRKTEKETKELQDDCQ